MKRTIIISAFIVLFAFQGFSAYMLIPMDNTQRNHLKAYGIAYWVLTQNVEISWLLNYRGGAFMFQHHQNFENECIIRDVSYQVIADIQASGILNEIADPLVNMDEVKLHKAPKIAVYSPPLSQPWDDAVTLALTYSEIPYDIIYNQEIIDGVLPLYDWLHLHHEDFTGQYGKFWSAYRNIAWYQDEVRTLENMAKRNGFTKVSQLKLSVAKRIQEFVIGGGYLFAMCSAPESLDIALAAEGVDICDAMFDGDPIDPNAQKKLDFSRTFAFADFQIVTNPYEYAKSNIDVFKTGRKQVNDLFTLFEFSAKWDQVPTMLCQNHVTVIKGFMGQSTAFRNEVIKPTVTIMGESKAKGETRYIHGAFGNGTFTFYGGHDPEDYEHFVGDPVTNLNLYPNSPGYRLILNNVLFPAAKKKKQKT
ncbi:MAG: asparagine synthetase B [Bacteroidales bacterium]|nr:asparagine synthetase B [Bacteroidales bacterium]MDZ4205375.1 asparagine synthetase B [Bacteroidales bacterium]